MYTFRLYTKCFNTNEVFIQRTKDIALKRWKKKEEKKCATKSKMCCVMIAIECLCDISSNVFNKWVHSSGHLLYSEGRIKCGHSVIGTITRPAIHFFPCIHHVCIYIYVQSHTAYRVGHCLSEVYFGISNLMIATLSCSLSLSFFLCWKKGAKKTL